MLKLILTVILELIQVCCFHDITHTGTHFNVNVHTIL